MSDWSKKIIDVRSRKKGGGKEFSSGGVAWIAVVVLLLIWFFAGGPIYKVDTDEEGVIQTFGKYSSSTGSGIHLKFPWPVQSVTKPKVAKVLRIEVGFRTINQGPPPEYIDASNNREMLREAQMLTGDENIVNSSLVLQYKIRNAPDYLFNVRNQERTLRDVIEAVSRQVLGNRPIDDALTDKKPEIQQEISEGIQKVADLYGLGIEVRSLQLQDVNPPEEVAQAFKDVATAKEDRARLVNEAKGYQNEKIPVARGNAAKLIRAPSITWKRMYFEAMADVLPSIKKVVVDSEASIINLNDISSGLSGKGGVK
jgi:membrane protease subunit HflK